MKLEVSPSELAYIVPRIAKGYALPLDSEVLTMKWAYIDYAKGIAHLPDSKMGEKNIHLPPPAMVILNALPRVNEYCFYGRGRK